MLCSRRIFLTRLSAGLAAAVAVATGSHSALAGESPSPPALLPSPPASLRDASIGVHLARGPSASPDPRVADIISRARERGSPLAAAGWSPTGPTRGAGLGGGPLGVRVTVGGVTLVEKPGDGLAVLHDPGVLPDVVLNAEMALTMAMADVPDLTGLPPSDTPVATYVLADEDRFRLALAEIGRVPVDLVAEGLGGYAVERNGTMLIFFAAPNVATPPSAVLGYAQEVSYLLIREATARQALPQWFNAGYATWAATLALERHHPQAAALQRKLDRLAVASALHTRGLIPWPDLVNRARFSRAGVDGLVSLAYGQSVLFVDRLGVRHGRPALRRFLTEIGGGAAATEAFGTAFGPFAGASADFEASLGALTSELAPGLYLLQRATADAPAVLGVAGGTAFATAIVEVVAAGETVRRREIDLDGAGMLVASVPGGLLDGATVRVTVPGLGALSLDPCIQERALAGG